MKPPSKTAHWASAACSQGVSRSHDQSIAALQRGLARRRAAGTREEMEAVTHAIDKLSGGKHPHPRRCQLDRERQPVEQPHDLGYRGAVGVAEDEVRPLCAGAGREEIDRFLLHRQRLDGKDLLARQVEPLAAGDDEGGVGRAVEPAAERGRGVLQDLLEVVQDD